VPGRVNGWISPAGAVLARKISSDSTSISRTTARRTMPAISWSPAAVPISAERMRIVVRAGLRKPA
jgi:hypothetical protein